MQNNLYDLTSNPHYIFPTSTIISVFQKELYAQVSYTCWFPFFTLIDVGVSSPDHIVAIQSEASSWTESKSDKPIFEEN